MTPRDIFVTAMRVIGVLQLIRAFDYALEVFDIYSGYYRPTMTTIGSCTTTHRILFRAWRLSAARCSSGDSRAVSGCAG